jgi:radical SAM protein with 4Fe4S-binding SPASM domain
MSDKFRLDGQKVSFHPHRVAQWLDFKDDWEKAKNIYPIYIEVSPTGVCQHRCTFCSVDYIGYKSDFIDVERFDDLAKEWASVGVKSNMFAGNGEPLVHPKINDMAASCLNSGIDVSITTNGVLLDRLDPIDRVSWIKVSINAGTRDTYAKVHRTKPEDFDRVVANMAAAVKRKGNCAIGAQMVLLPENQHEVDTLKKIGADIGLDYVVIKPFTQSISVKPQYDSYIPPPEAASNLIVRQHAFNTRGFPYDKCHATPYFWAFLMENGDLYSCSANHLLDDKFNLGNIYKQSFLDIWHGEKRKANWKYVRNQLDISECRVNCRMHQTNIYLEDLVSGVPHANFI